MAAKNEAIQVVRVDQQCSNTGESRVPRGRFPVDVFLEPAGKPECRSFARHAGDADPPAHQIDELLRDRESQSRSAESPRGRSIRLSERREETLLVGFGDADSGV